MRLTLIHEEIDFKQVVENAMLVPDIGDTVGIQPPGDPLAKADYYLLPWVESRRLYIDGNGHQSADIYLTGSPLSIVDTTIVDSCRRALRMEGVVKI